METHADDLIGKRVVRRAGLSGELIAILAVGVMLAGLVFTTGTWIRDDVQVLRDDVRDVQYGLGELRERVVRIETGLSGLRERVARVEERLVRVESGLGEVHERVIRIESLLQEDSIGRQG